MKRKQCQVGFQHDKLGTKEWFVNWLFVIRVGSEYNPQSKALYFVWTTCFFLLFFLTSIPFDLFPVINHNQPFRSGKCSICLFFWLVLFEHHFEIMFAMFHANVIFIRFLVVYWDKNQKSRKLCSTPKNIMHWGDFVSKYHPSETEPTLSFAVILPTLQVALRRWRKHNTKKLYQY